MDIIIMVILLVLLASLRAFPLALVDFFTPSPPGPRVARITRTRLARSRLQASNASSPY